MATTHKTGGLVPSALIAGLSLGILTVILQACGPGGRAYRLLVHGSAVMSLSWALGGWLATGISARPARSGRPSQAIHDWMAVLRVIALTLGLLAFIPMLFQAVLEATHRAEYLLLFQLLGPQWQADVWPLGFVDIALLAGAIVVGRIQSGDRRLITALFWLAVFATLWAGLQIPASKTLNVDGHLIRESGMLWSAVFMAGAGAAVGLFVLANGWVRHRRRLHAWPDDLWRLTSPPPAWPGFRYSAGLMGVAILVLGLVHVTTLWTPAVALVAGAGVLVLVGYEWEENLADVGLALMTIGVVSVVTLWRCAATSDSDYFAEIINRAMIGLAIMTAFWHWLADVSMQQLDRGQAWTTAGRLIRADAAGGISGGRHGTVGQHEPDHVAAAEVRGGG